MRVDATKETFEEVTVLGKPMLFIVKRFVHQTKTEKSTTQRGDA